MTSPPRATGVFVDPARARSVPYRLYPPQGAEGPAPLVVFSHGLGGSRAAAPFLARALAEAGYCAVVLQHQGSDARLLEEAEGAEAARRALRDSLQDPANMINRYLDVSFALDALAALAADPGSELAGRIDPDRAGVAGHSYGARTVMALAGQAVGAVGPEFKDPRFGAGVALSPSGARGPGDSDLLPPDQFAWIDMPLLHVTGTEDKSELGDNPDYDPYVRTLPFQHIPVDDQFLLVLHGATHDDFSGTRRDGNPAPDTRYTVITAEVAVLFFDAYLKGSETAWYNLRNRLGEYLDPEDYYEFR